MKDAIEKTEHTRSPDKHEKLKQKHILLHKQHDAIANNKELDEKDKQIRQNVKTQHQCDKIKDSLTNSEPKKTISQNVQPQINNQKKQYDSFVYKIINHKTKKGENYV